MNVTLALEVVGPEAAALGGGRQHVFSSGGGVIGRVKTSDWVLAHTKVSGRHAVITCMDGTFYIEDTSTNGVFLNSPRNRLVAGRRYALESGDVLFIDPYQISITVSSEDAGFERDTLRGSGDARRRTPPPLVEDPFASAPPEPRGRPTPASPRATPFDSEPEAVADEELDPLKLIGFDQPARPAIRKAPTAAELDHRSVMSGHYEPPVPVAPRGPTPPPTPPPTPAYAIPEDYDPLRDDFVDSPLPTPPPPAPRPTPAPPPPMRVTPPPVPVPVVEEEEEETVEEIEEVPPPAVTSRPTPPPTPPPVAVPAVPAAAPVGEPGSAGGLAALLEGAGLADAIPATPELARSFGRIFRIVVAGVMDVLRSRQDIKDEFRMRMTQFRPADNNPLKFSANVDDALHNLLVKRNQAYLQPVEAFEDAFDDLRHHQLAMLAGMRVAFESMLAQFGSERLEKQFDRQLKRRPILRLIARFRYWDQYRDHLDDLGKDPEETFKKLFGAEFARAYEEQLAQIKAEAQRGDANGQGPRGSKG